VQPLDAHGGTQTLGSGHPRGPPPPRISTPLSLGDEEEARSLPMLNRGDDHEQQLRPSRPSRLVLPPPGRHCARGELIVPKIDALEQSPSASRASTARNSRGPLGLDKAHAPPSSSCTSLRRLNQHRHHALLLLSVAPLPSMVGRCVPRRHTGPR
jgi:hypothetical protein